MKALQLEVGVGGDNGDNGYNECASVQIKPNAQLGLCWVVVCPLLLDAFSSASRRRSAQVSRPESEVPYILRLEPCIRFNLARLHQRALQCR